MPQMKPLYWMFILYFVSLLLMLKMINIFFLYMNFSPLMLTKKFKKNYWNWKW
uniref:ATP synthase F0 subunit 8 n=1 Tax=Paraponera clavata TaxID=55425 RepID=UPI002A7FA04F|nr:ATP synthase F0 subunit 8 [Paraponera clavata]WNO15839.1 ATP synthase F0 subunit 8 [Paraponera clavata]